MIFRNLGKKMCHGLVNKISTINNSETEYQHPAVLPISYSWCSWKQIILRKYLDIYFCTASSIRPW